MSSKRIEELDPNFKVIEADENDIAWRDVHQLTLEGVGWPSESAEYCRLPGRVQGVVRDPVWELSRHSAGLCARFISDAPRILARWTVLNETLAMGHMPASGVSGLDLYARNPQGQWCWAAVGIPSATENEVTLLGNIPPQQREYSLYLPLYNGVAKVEIGVPQSTHLEAAPPRAKRVGFYGTSIVQGGCASRPGMAYPAILGRALDCQTINLGFSGNGQSEPEVAALLAELHVDAWVLDPLPNMQADTVRERIAPFIHTLRAAQPDVPIVLVENVTYQNEWLVAERKQRSASSNTALREVYEQVLKDSFDNLQYVHGAELLGDDGEGTVDGCHPTDIGFMRMSEVLLPVLRPLLTAA